MTMSSPGAEPLVTIGIPTFNRLGRTFPAALSSALGQTFPNLEVVVCDNASDDGTEAFMAKQRDPRLRYHRHPVNIGANANFNACLDQARGAWFLLLPDDDLLEPTFVARAMASLAGRTTGAALGGIQVIDGAGAVCDRVRVPEPNAGPTGLFLQWFGRRTSFYLVSTLFHAQTLREAGGFESPEGLLQDVVAIARVTARRGYASVPGIAGSFRRHDSNRGTAEGALRWTRDAEYLLEVLQDELPADRERLYQAGAPYLSEKCYRYVAAVRSAPERRRLYDEINRRFGRSYAPWRFHVRHARLRMKSIARNLLRRSAATARPNY